MKHSAGERYTTKRQNNGWVFDPSALLLPHYGKCAYREI